MTVSNQRRTGEIRFVELTPEMRAALCLWTSVSGYGGTGADPWESAITLEQLLGVGLTQCDLRWLVTKGYVRHACEITVPGDVGRRFQPGRNLAFTSETRFLLTDAGASLAGKQDAAAAQPEAIVATDEDHEGYVLQMPTPATPRQRRHRAA
jgi:hypothetical protein